MTAFNPYCAWPDCACEECSPLETGLVLRREAILPQEEEHYLQLGRSTAPWYKRWFLALVAFAHWYTAGMVRSPVRYPRKP